MEVSVSESFRDLLPLRRFAICKVTKSVVTTCFEASCDGCKKFGVDLVEHVNRSVMFKNIAREHAHIFFSVVGELQSLEGLLYVGDHGEADVLEVPHGVGEQDASRRTKR